MSDWLSERRWACGEAPARVEFRAVTAGDVRAWRKVIDGLGQAPRVGRCAQRPADYIPTSSAGRLYAVARRQYVGVR
jgi:hypothetical protein